MTNDIAAAEQAYYDARKARMNAEQTEKAALDYWMTLRIEQGRANLHPLAGKNVVRTGIRRPAYNVWDTGRDGRKPKAVQERGIVTLFTETRQGFHIRGHSPLPGEWYVASKSGQTGYRLTEEWIVE